MFPPNTKTSHYRRICCLKPFSSWWLQPQSASLGKTGNWARPYRPTSLLGFQLNVSKNLQQLDSNIFMLISDLKLNFQQSQMSVLFGCRLTDILSSSMFQAQEHDSSLCHIQWKRETWKCRDKSSHVVAVKITTEFVWWVGRFLSLNRY